MIWLAMLSAVQPECVQLIGCFHEYNQTNQLTEYTCDKGSKI